MRRVPSVIIDYVDLDAIVRLVYCCKAALLMGKYDENLIGIFCHVGIIWICSFMYLHMCSQLNRLRRKVALVAFYSPMCFRWRLKLLS